MSGITAAATTAALPLAAHTDAHEQGYAHLAILILRDNGVTDADIVMVYTVACPRADRAMEAQYLAETGQHIEMKNVKRRMRELVCN